MDYKSISDFAVKWRKRFQRGGDKASMLVDNPRFPEECRRLGFVIDMGERLNYTCGEEYTSSFEWMNEHVHEIKDFRGLGNAIYSKWRYYNGYAYSSDELDKPGNREWFSLAFKRLETLANAASAANADKDFED